MEFEWDKNKAATNVSKHGVSFDEAKTVFEDAFYLVYDDPDHSNYEDRSIIIGESANRRLLIVSYTERGNVTRLISGREATPKEKQVYQEGGDINAGWTSAWVWFEKHAG